MKNTIILLILFAACLKGYSRDVPDTTVPFSSIPIYYSSNHDSDRIIGLVSLGAGLWANKTFWAIDLKKDKAPINSPIFTGTPKKGADTLATLSDVRTLGGSNYALPTASSTVLGGIKIGSGLAIDGAGIVSATGGSSYTLNNLQTDIVVYSGSNTLSLRQNANKVNAVWVFDTVANQVVQVPRALFSFTPGTNLVTFVQGSGAALQSGDKVWIDYDIGAAYGVLDSSVIAGFHSMGYYNLQYYPLAAGNTSATNITTLQGYFTAGILNGTSFPALTGDVTTSAGSLAATLSTSGVTAGTYGDATHVPVITVDAKGRATTVTTALISGGGGGSVFPTQQVDATTGTTVTVTNQGGNIWLLKNPATAVASYTITFPATPVDGQRMWISFGGTISSGVVASSLSEVGNGSTILQSTVPATVNAGETIEYQYTASNTTWYRIK